MWWVLVEEKLCKSLTMPVDSKWLRLYPALPIGGVNSSFCGKRGFPGIRPMLLMTTCRAPSRPTGEPSIGVVIVPLSEVTSN